MRLIEKITEDEMVAIFLQAEIMSPRFGAHILHLLKKYQIDRKIVDNPNIKNVLENKLRAKLLGDFRGYKQNRELFENFPDDVRWYRVLLNRDDLHKTKYMNYSYWIDLSGGSRLVSDAVKKFLNSELEKAASEWIRTLADAVKRNFSFNELILVGTDEGSDLIMLEGHARITAYLAYTENLPAELMVIAGYSEKIEEWDKD